MRSTSLPPFSIAYSSNDAISMSLNISFVYEHIYTHRALHKHFERDERFSMVQF